jgi:sporulation protein YlmC with PRC-barrel domain
MIATLLASALCAPAALVYAQNAKQPPPDIQRWNPSSLYPDGWTAEEMIGTEVRGENGEDIGDVKDIIVDRHGIVSKLVVEVGGFLELGDQHIGVPWKDVKIGQHLAFVQVPLKEVESGTYSLFGTVPQGEHVPAESGAWRVNELIGDYDSLQDVKRNGLVSDEVINSRDQGQGVVVDPGRPGAFVRYAYPFVGYYPGALAYPLPYHREAVVHLAPFEYSKLAAQSDYSRGGASAGQTRPRDK